MSVLSAGERYGCPTPVMNHGRMAIKSRPTGVATGGARAHMMRRSATVHPGEKASIDATARPAAGHGPRGRRRRSISSSRETRIVNVEPGRTTRSGAEKLFGNMNDPPSSTRRRTSNFGESTSRRDAKPSVSR